MTNGPGRAYLFNIRMALDEPHSARVLLMNEKRHSIMARVERGILNSIPRPRNVNILRRFVMDTEERPPRRVMVKRGIYSRESINSDFLFNFSSIWVI